MLRGFDVSHHQGAEDWSRWRDQYGISFGVAKATEGEGFRDDRFDQNWAGMAKAGIVRGAYNFARPDATPVDDVDAFLAAIDRAGGLEPTDLLVCDLEVSNLTAGQTAAWAAGWADELKRRTAGRFAPVLYCGGYMDLSAYSGLRNHFARWWYPRYAGAGSSWPTTMTTRLPVPNVWGRGPDFWQFSQSFAADGDPHDANVYDGTLDQLRLINPGARPSPPVLGDDVTTEDIEAIAAAVEERLGIRVDQT